VSVEVNCAMGYQMTKKDVTKQSTDHAREVINKSVSRIHSKVKEERTTKNLRETEEKNTHVIDNRGDKATHMAGIYHWVDMLYEAQIYNYGKRQMMQFMIPEPSEYYEHAREVYGQYMKDKAIKELDAPPEFTLNSPDDITEGVIGIEGSGYREANYLTEAGKYNAEGIEPPPPQCLYSTAGFGKITKSDNSNQWFVDTCKEEGGGVEIPYGYQAGDLSDKYNMSYTLAIVRRNNGGGWQDAGITVSIGGRNVAFTWDTKELKTMVTGDNGKKLQWINKCEYKGGIPGARTLPVTICTREIAAYAFNVWVRFERTEELYKEWQIKTFNAIRKAYLEMKLIYEQKLAVQEELAEQRSGVTGSVTGKNPRINRDIERTELKKQCIRILMDNCLGQKFGEFNTGAGNQNSQNEPEIDYGPMSTSTKQEPAKEYVEFDIADAMREGSYIQFFEQAFEWENMTYIFYPYFWSNREKWDVKCMTFDDDPQFTKFLQAGAARVVLPVRDKYEDVVNTYLETGAIWKGGTAPVINDPLFLSIAEELKNQTDESKGKPEGEPWDVIVPTSHLYLESGDTALPKFDQAK